MRDATPSERPLWLLDGARESVVRRGRADAAACAGAEVHRPSARRREALNMKNKNVSGKVVKSFAYSLAGVAAGFVSSARSSRASSKSLLALCRAASRGQHRQVSHGA